MSEKNKFNPLTSLKEAQSLSAEQQVDRLEYITSQRKALAERLAATQDASQTRVSSIEEKLNRVPPPLHRFSNEDSRQFAKRAREAGQKIETTRLALSIDKQELEKRVVRIDEIASKVATWIETAKRKNTDIIAESFISDIDKVIAFQEDVDAIAQYQRSGVITLGEADEYQRLLSDLELMKKETALKYSTRKTREAVEVFQKNEPQVSVDVMLTELGLTESYIQAVLEDIQFLVTDIERMSAKYRPVIAKFLTSDVVTAINIHQIIGHEKLLPFLEKLNEFLKPLNLEIVLPARNNGKLPYESTFYLALINTTVPNLAGLKRALLTHLDEFYEEQENLLSTSSIVNQAAMDPKTNGSEQNFDSGNRETDSIKVKTDVFELKPEHLQFLLPSNKANYIYPYLEIYKLIRWAETSEKVVKTSDIVALLPQNTTPSNVRRKLQDRLSKIGLRLELTKLNRDEFAYALHAQGGKNKQAIYDEIDQYIAAEDPSYESELSATSGTTIFREEQAEISDHPEQSGDIPELVAQLGSEDTFTTLTTGISVEHEKLRRLLYQFVKTADKPVSKKALEELIKNNPFVTDQVLLKNVIMGLNKLLRKLNVPEKLVFSKEKQAYILERNENGDYSSDTTSMLEPSGSTTEADFTLTSGTLPESPSVIESELVLPLDPLYSFVYTLLKDKEQQRAVKKTDLEAAITKAGFLQYQKFVNFIRSVNGFLKRQRLDEQVVFDRELQAYKLVKVKRIVVSEKASSVSGTAEPQFVAVDTEEAKETLEASYTQMLEHIWTFLSHYTEAIDALINHTSEKLELQAALEATKLHAEYLNTLPSPLQNGALKQARNDAIEYMLTFPDCNESVAHATEGLSEQCRALFFSACKLIHSLELVLKNTQPLALLNEDDKKQYGSRLSKFVSIFVEDRKQVSVGHNVIVPAEYSSIVPHSPDQENSSTIQTIFVQLRAIFVPPTSPHTAE